jgi:hypothetical protein
MARLSRGAVVNQSFSFEDAGRTFACRVEEARTPHTTAWWWFTVSSDNYRYAPFHADATDTEDSVRTRIVSYYDTLLVRRAAPRQPWRRADRPVVAPGAPGAPPVTPEEPGTSRGEQLPG